MPSAPDDLREEWDQDDGLGDERAAAFLREHGWRMSREFMWSSPAPLTDLSEKEYRALMYLIMEWDYGYAGYTPAFLMGKK